ncbi:MAG: FecR domain-containing protein [Cyclobacteriaceae bacterium]
MSNKEIYSMIGKKLAGQTSELEDKIFANWLSDSKKNQEIFREQEEIWKVESHYKKKEKEERLYAKVQQVIAELEEPANSAKLSWFYGRKVIKYAAAISLIVLGLAAGLFYPNAPIDFSSNASLAEIEKANPKGQKSKIHLPDGSVVFLNAGSKLIYPSKFSRDSRQLELIGEAYFEVAKDKYRPFVVKSGDIVTTALGTAFNVRAFADDDILEIALTEGEVRVDNVALPDNEHYLTPGECVRYKKSNSNFIKTHFSIEEVTTWKDGVLVFKDATMKDVVSKLELWYDVDFEVEGSSDEIWSYSGQFKNEYLNRVLQSISYAQDFEFDIKDKKVLIKY